MTHPPDISCGLRSCRIRWRSFGMSRWIAGSSRQDTYRTWSLWWGRVAATALVIIAPLASAQEALRSSLAGDAAAEARHVQQQDQPYTIKSGDFKLLVTPSLGLDWNDNVNLSKSGAQQDFILKPLVQMVGSYPLTEMNVLSLNIGVGYDQYFQHDQYSSLRLTSGSELSFDAYIKDVWINLHDRFQYIQDPGTQAAVSGTGLYGGLDNTAGLSATWDLGDVNLTGGYDHQNFVSSSSQYSYTDRSSELLLLRAGFLLRPAVTAGLEGTAGFTRYQQQVLNDNNAYSAGLYSDWRPGHYLRVESRAGYALYHFLDTSHVIHTEDLDAWYIDLTVTHEILDALGYSISAGHELRLGIESDVVDAWYVRPNLHWNVRTNLSVQTFLSYEHGKQGRDNATGSVTENYDWFGGGVGASYALMKKLTAGLNYRLTLRSSSIPSRAYAQDLVGLQFTYWMK